MSEKGKRFISAHAKNTRAIEFIFDSPGDLKVGDSVCGISHQDLNGNPCNGDLRVTSYDTKTRKGKGNCQRCKATNIPFIEKVVNLNLGPYPPHND